MEKGYLDEDDELIDTLKNDKEFQMDEDEEDELAPDAQDYYDDLDPEDQPLNEDENDALIDDNYSDQDQDDYNEEFGKNQIYNQIDLK
jgi:hypothetical protein